MMNLLSSPTIQYCEKPVQGLIKRPYYALSNVVFIISGLYILYKGKMSRLAKIFGFTAIAIGILSFTYDATYVYVSQLFDLAGMLLFVNILMFLNLEKLLKASTRMLVGLIALFAVAMLAIVSFRGFAGNFVFGSYVIAVAVSEYLLFKRKANKQYKKWVIAFTLFLVGFAVWMLDSTRTVCFTFGLLNGRALFHYTNALSIYFLYQFYELNANHA